jgi:anti-sigma factor RsiW
MTEQDGPEMAGGAALWARTRAGLAPVAEPDALLLAAYAENRLSEEDGAAVESWLARHPEALDTVLAARAASAAGALPLGRPAEIAAARSLVSGAHGGGTPRPQFMRGIAWGSVAAGLLVASLVGYEAGVATGGHTSVAFSSLASEMGFGIGGNDGLLADAMGLGDAGEEL